MLSTGTREAAFVHALSSAAVAVAVTRGCSRGELERCGCDRKVRGVSPEGESNEKKKIHLTQTHEAKISHLRDLARAAGTPSSLKLY